MVGLRPITFIFKTQRAKWTFAAVDQNVCYADKAVIERKLDNDSFVKLM
mgnify:CR=1 FL=1